MKILKALLAILFLACVLLGTSYEASAVPSLQLYIPGAEYDMETETWVFPGFTYDLWAIGADSDANVTIDTVNLAAAVKSGQTGTIQIQPYIGQDDLGDPLASVLYLDTTPLKSDGKPLPDHGIYPSDFYQYELGDFALTEEGIPDFDETYDPDNPEPTNNYGLIVKFHVTVTGFDWVHFDLFNHIDGERHALFAPFSHDADAEDGGTPVPEPATMLMVGTGLVGLAGFGRKRLLKR